MALKYNNIFNNVLVSYEYLRANDAFSDLCFQLHKDGKINLMIDSGAFSVYKKPHAKELTVEDYAGFLKSNHETCNKYVTLDVIGNQKETESNYKKMISLGLNPMYVLTMANEKLDLVKEAVENQPYICVAGGFSTKGDWIKQRFQKTYNMTEGKAQIHGLAYVNFKDMFALPLQSVDSSSWLSGARFGTLTYFSRSSGLKKVAIKDVVTGKVKISQELKETFFAHGIQPKHLKENKYKTGSNSVMSYLDTIANIEYQKYAKRQGLDYFLACATTQYLINYTSAVIALENKLTYEQWLEML